MMRAITSKARDCAVRFLRARDGVMAVEFSLIAPVMIFLFFATIELTDAILAKRRVEMAASTVGDLVTNRALDFIYETEAKEIIALSGRVLEPYGIEDVEVRMTAITWDDTLNEPVVVWSRISDSAAGMRVPTEPEYTPGAPFPRMEDNAFLGPGERLVASDHHIVLTELRYPFVSTLSNVVFKSFEMNVPELRLPRIEPFVRFCDDVACSDGTLWDPARCLPADVPSSREPDACTKYPPIT